MGQGKPRRNPPTFTDYAAAPTAMTNALLSPSHRRISRSSITRTVVWVSMAFLLFALPGVAEAGGHRARLSRGLAEGAGAGAGR